MSSYLGNSSLKDTNVKVQWTQHKLDELQRCKEDPNYFITKYIKVVTLDEGVTAFNLWAFQHRLINAVHNNRFTICTMPRQSGKSTTMVAYFLHYILFNKSKTVGILANKRDLAIELLSRLQLAFELLPQWLQQGVKVWNKSKIELENGCKIEAHATSGSSVRGKTFNIILLDEFAHIENKLADKFWTSTFPVISSGTTSKVIIVSTPNGMNLFQDLWEKSKLAPPHIQAIGLPEGKAQLLLTEAQKNGTLNIVHKDWNQFVPIEVHYTEVPGREKPEWAEKMISIIGQDRFDQEFGCEFLGSGTTLIAGRFLKLITVTNPLHSQNDLDVWEDPKVDFDQETGIKSPHAYVMCVDTARGKKLDYSAFTVIDVTDSPYKVVAKYRSNVVPTMTFADIICSIGKKYNNAYILIEVDGPGHQIADDLHHVHEYENILLVATKGRSGQILATGFGNTGKNVQRGIKMSTPVRRTGCANLKTLIEMKKLLFWDNEIKTELSTFALKGESEGAMARYEALPGTHDDLVMTLVSFSWLTTQKHFRDMMEAKIRMSLQVEFEANMNHDLTPYGWKSDGIEDKPWYENDSKKDPDLDGGQDLWTRVNDDVWSRYEQDQLRNHTKYDPDAMDRLRIEYGWS